MHKVREIHEAMEKSINDCIEGIFVAILVKAIEEIDKIVKQVQADCFEVACAIAKEIGYPLWVRASGLGSGFCNNETELRALVARSLVTVPQVIIKKSLRGWKDIEICKLRTALKDRFVTKEEFDAAFKDERVNTSLERLGIDPNRVKGVFKLNDNGDGQMSLQELIPAVWCSLCEETEDSETMSAIEPEDEEDWSDEDDDDQGRENVKDPQNFVGLIDHLSMLEKEGTVVVEALHCANYWEMHDTVLPLQHHGLILKLANGNYLRLHLLRDGLAWKSYDMHLPDARPPQMPSNLVFQQVYEVTNEPVTELSKFCRANHTWSWPMHDCEQFAKGALKTLGIGSDKKAASEKVRDWLSGMGMTATDAFEESKRKMGYGTSEEQQQQMTEEPSSEEKVQAGAMEYAKQEYERKMFDVDEKEKQLRAWLKENGFGTDVNSGRRKKLAKTYPLHVAAKHNEPGMVQLLLRFGADSAKTNSYGRTPLGVANKYDKDGSHAQVIAILEAPSWDKNRP